MGVIKWADLFFGLREKENGEEKMWSVLFDVSVLSGVQKRWRAVEDFSQIKGNNIEIGGSDYEQ